MKQVIITISFKGWVIDGNMLAQIFGPQAARISEAFFLRMINSPVSLCLN